MPAAMPPAPPSSAPDTPAVVRSLDSFDLAHLAPDDPSTPPAKLDLGITAPHCPISHNGDIVVCAPDQSRYRLPPLVGDYTVVNGLPKAETRMGNATLDVHTEAETLLQGVISNRVMVGIKLPF